MEETIAEMKKRHDREVEELIKGCEHNFLILKMYSAFESHEDPPHIIERRLDFDFIEAILQCNKCGLVVKTKIDKEKITGLIYALNCDGDVI